MTDDHRTDDDPTRTLDEVTPPDQWGEITERAADPVTPTRLEVPTEARSRRPYLLAAAAVLVVAAVAGGLALAARDDSGTDQVVAGPSAAGSLDDPHNVVGRTWLLERFVKDGTELTVPQPGQYDPPTFSIADDGQVHFRGCNRSGASGQIDGDRLTLSDEWFSTLAGCMGPEGEALMALDDAMGALVRAEPRVELSLTELSLVADGSEAHFVERTDGRPNPTVGDNEADVALVPSGEASCAVGLNASVDPERRWPIGPGRADPAVVDPSWGDLDGVTTQGIWNLVDEDQRIEIHVPGLMVMDLVGERTEEVLLGENWRATVWFTDEWVQVRYFSGSTTPNPCVSFTVTATGATEDQNRDAAVAVARSLVIEERGEG